MEFRPSVWRAFVPFVSLLVVIGAGLGILVLRALSDVAIAVGVLWMVSLAVRAWPHAVAAVAAARGPHPAIVPEGVRLRENRWRLRIDTLLWREISGLWIQRIGRRWYLAVRPHATRTPRYIRLAGQSHHEVAEAVAALSGGAKELGDGPGFDAHAEEPFRARRGRPRSAFAYVIPAVIMVVSLSLWTAGPSSWRVTTGALPDPCAIGTSAFGGGVYVERRSERSLAARSCLLEGERTTLEIAVQNLGTTDHATAELKEATAGAGVESYSGIGDQAFFGGSFASGRDTTLVYQSVGSLVARKGSRTVVINYRGQVARQAVLDGTVPLARAALR
jgi:hypothetical protein